MQAADLNWLKKIRSSNPRLHRHQAPKGSNQHLVKWKMHKQWLGNEKLSIWPPGQDAWHHDCIGIVCHVGPDTDAPQVSAKGRDNTRDYSPRLNSWQLDVQIVFGLAPSSLRPNRKSNRHRPQVIQLTYHNLTQEIARAACAIVILLTQICLESRSSWKPDTPKWQKPKKKFKHLVSFPFLVAAVSPQQFHLLSAVGGDDLVLGGVMMWVTLCRT